MATNGKPTIVPPQNLEAEESVLGAMMVSESTIEPVLLDVRLHAEDFYRDRHRTIYEAIIRLNENADPVDVLTVSEALAQARRSSTAIGGRDVVASLAAKVPAPGSAKHYAQIVKQNSLMRRLDMAAKQIQQSVAERDGEPSEMVEQAERLLFQVAHEERAVDFREIGEILHDEIDKLEALASGTSDITGTPSGFRDLDEKTGGFQPGNLIVIAARPAMGKSTLVCDFAQNVAMKHKSRSPSSPWRCRRWSSPTASSARSRGSPATGCARARSRRRTGRRWSRPATSSSPRRSGSTTPPTLALLELRAKARRLQAQEKGRGHEGLGHGDRRLHAADAQRRCARQPCRAGLTVQPRTQDPRP